MCLCVCFLAPADKNSKGHQREAPPLSPRHEAEPCVGFAAWMEKSNPRHPPSRPSHRSRQCASPGQADGSVKFLG